MDYGVRCVLGDGGVEEHPYVRDYEHCIVECKLLVCGGDDASDIVR